MEHLNGKRLLLLGGSRWRSAIADYARDNGITLIAASNDPHAKFFDIAQERYVISSTDADAMKKLIREKNIDGVYVGSHEVVISVACKYLRELGLPCYCTEEQLNVLNNKENFKMLCASVGLPVAPQFQVDETDLERTASGLAYPLVVKPVDGYASNGVSVCNNADEFFRAYDKAKKLSRTNKALAEKFVDNSSALDVFYTFSKGKIIFSGLDSIYSVNYKNSRTYVAGLHVFENHLKDEFRERFEDKLIRAFKSINLQEGNLWIEVFHDGDNYYFNECAYRYLGSLSIYPIDYFYGINQVASDLHYALTGKSCVYGHNSLIPASLKRKKYYGIYAVHLKAGTIAEITGIDKFSARENVVVVVEAKSVGDTVEDTGTFAHIFALVHFVFDTHAELVGTVNAIHEKIIVKDADGNNMVNRMLDVETVTTDFFERKGA